MHKEYKTINILNFKSIMQKFAEMGHLLDLNIRQKPEQKHHDCSTVTKVLQLVADDSSERNYHLLIISLPTGIFCMFFFVVC